jgi:hypothetical protein
LVSDDGINATSRVKFATRRFARVRRLASRKKNSRARETADGVAIRLSTRRAPFAYSLGRRRGDVGAMAMLTVFYDVEGNAESRRFDEAPPAINFAVRLVQTYNGDLAKVVVRDGEGGIVFTEDEIRSLSRQVRLG